MDWNEWINDNALWFLLLLIWSLTWKGLALWRAARNSDKAWFVALLILNTIGLLEIFYLFVFSKRAYKTVPEKSAEKKNQKSGLTTMWSE